MRGGGRGVQHRRWDRGRRKERKKERKKRGDGQDSAYNTLFNIAPPQQRRLFIDGAGFHGGTYGMDTTVWA
jgi:hypothetical protein